MFKFLIAYYDFNYDLKDGRKKKVRTYYNILTRKELWIETKIYGG